MRHRPAAPGSERCPRGAQIGGQCGALAGDPAGAVVHGEDVAVPVRDRRRQFDRIVRIDRCGVPGETFADPLVRRRRLGGPAASPRRVSPNDPVGKCRGGSVRPSRRARPVAPTPHSPRAVPAASRRPARTSDAANTAFSRVSATTTATCWPTCWTVRSDSGGRRSSGRSYVSSCGGACSGGQLRGVSTVSTSGADEAAGRASVSEGLAGDNSHAESPTARCSRVPRRRARCRPRIAPHL